MARRGENTGKANYFVESARAALAARTVARTNSDDDLDTTDNIGSEFDVYGSDDWGRE